MTPLRAEDVLSTCQVAELLSLPTSTVEALARRGELPSAKVGKTRRYLREQVEAMLRGRP